MSAVSPLLELDQFICLRGGETVFAPVDLRLLPGEILWLTGPNGAGKTSLLRGLLGLVESHYERWFFDGQPLPTAMPWLLDQTCWVGHDAALKAELTLAENLRFDCGQRGQRPRIAIESALEKVGLPGFAPLRAGTLSAGQRRRAALARLALRDARLWLLDEPLANLDAASSASLATWIGEFARAGGAVILTGHGQLPAALAVRELRLELPQWH
jgi:heme exporter protein A